MLTVGTVLMLSTVFSHDDRLIPQVDSLFFVEASPSPQEGECGGQAYYETIPSVDTLCCPPDQQGERTCAQVRCDNHFCRLSSPGTTYRCWRDLALCLLLYCAESNQMLELWREEDWAIPCEVGPILTKQQGRLDGFNLCELQNVRRESNVR